MSTTTPPIIIIALIGDTRVGKDTLASILTTPEYGFNRLAFADPIKDVAKSLFQFTDDQCSGNDKDILDERWNITPRQFFQQFGTEIMQRDIYNYLPSLSSSIPPRHFWSLRLIKQMKFIIMNSDIRKFVITDVRFCHELEDLLAFQDKFKDSDLNIKIKTIKITRPSITHASLHSSHTSINSIPDSSIHHHIQNNGTLDEFLHHCRQLLTEIYSECFNY
jgi:hypothetical protein